MSLLGSIGSIAGGAIGKLFGGSDIGKEIGGALGNSLSSMASTAYSYHMDMEQAKELMNLQYEQQKKLALNKYPWEVQSLEAAGLNPILAATRGASAYSANAPVIQAKRGQEAVNSALALGQLDNLGAQNALLKAQAATQSASASQIQEQTTAIKRVNDLIKKYPGLLLDQEIAKAGSGPIEQVKKIFSFFSNSLSGGYGNGR